ncbi:small subunit of acetolactate synthase-domain-containing protein [Paraphysoderma sedebokerense]|nr:small subunit of acetolactate synthase-domain-containing protein [Paraphysoderma sedebokerense]
MLPRSIFATAIRRSSFLKTAPLAAAPIALPLRFSSSSSKPKASISESRASTPKPHRYRKRKSPILEFNNSTPSTVEEAVTNILYNTPMGPNQPVTKHVLNCLVTNEPGVLSRISGILAARGFNIDSLVVSSTDVQELSRMTIVLRGQDTTIDQAKKQLEDLVPVWAVLDYTNTKLVQREMLLVKVNIVPVEIRQYLDTIEDEEEMEANENHPEMNRSHKSPLPFPTPGHINPLLSTHLQLQSLKSLTNLFNGRIVDVSSESAIIELCAKPDRINNFLKLLQPFGIIEAAKSGMMALTRSPVDGVYESEVEEEEKVEIDAGLLPPS